MLRVGLILVVLGLTLASFGNAATHPSIHISAIQLNDSIYNTVDLNYGPAWWPNSSRPGRGGVIGIAGHRTTHSHPFGRLDELHKGDRIKLSYGGREFVYKVIKKEFKPWSDKYILFPSPKGYELLVLTTCHPPGSASFRLVVTGILMKD